MDLAQFAPVFLDALDRARNFAGKTVVVKLGGSAMEEPTATWGTLRSIAAIWRLGWSRIILVHGGGKPIDRAMAAAGIEPRKVQGRRYTDATTLSIVVRVLFDLNAQLVNALSRIHGASASGYSDALHPAVFPVAANKLILQGSDLQPVDLGHVGTPAHVDLYPFTSKIIRGINGASIVVLPSLARDLSDEKAWLNVNADTAASAVAGALKADAAIFLTDTPGVLANRNDPSSLYARLTLAECRELIASGVIAGGMIPKVEACFEALEAGAQRAVILDGRNPYALLGEFLTDTPAGTTITRD